MFYDNTINGLGFFDDKDLKRVKHFNTLLFTLIRIIISTWKECPIPPPLPLSPLLASWLFSSNYSGVESLLTDQSAGSLTRSHAGIVPDGLVEWHRR